MAERPNIVFLMSDQQKASATSVHGNPHVPTPFMAEMADSGITFRHAYAASSICTPSRASIMTGVEPLVHQVTCHQNRAPYNLPQLPELLAEAGYYTAAAGHYESKRNLARGWHEQVSCDERSVLADAMIDWATTGRCDVGWSAGRLGRPVEQSHDYLLTDRVELMLDAAKASGAPFFLHVCYLQPHPPYYVPSPYDAMVDAASLPLPIQGGPSRPNWQRQCLIECGTAGASADEIKKVVAHYYGMIALVDAQMRRVHQALAQRQILDNTWIIIASDHGDYAGEKGLFTKTESLYECLLHVPLIIRPPESSAVPRGIQIDRLVSLMDLFPTILGLADSDTPEHVQGFDLMAWVAQGAQTPLRDYLFAQVGDYHGHLKTTFPGGIAESGRRRRLVQGARSTTWSYMRDADAGDEAYDLQSDPFELNNLLNDSTVPAAAEVDALRRCIDEHEQQCLQLRNRLGVVPGYRGFDANW